VPIAPAAHYAMGGIRVDSDSLTTLASLYAAGECACTGIHGANRLASNSLLEGLVFGTESGERAASLSEEELLSMVPSPPAIHGDGYGRDGSLDVSETTRELRRLMWDECGIVRSAEGLARAVAQIGEWEHRLGRPPAEREAIELCSMLTVGLRIAESALRREESRGAHNRIDFPESDDGRWRCRIVSRLDVGPESDGSTVATEIEPLEKGDRRPLQDEKAPVPLFQASRGTGGDHMTLHEAARDGLRDDTERLLAEGADANCRGDDGWSPLHGAAKGGHVEIGELLIAEGADVNAVTDHGWTPLHNAAKNGHAEMAELLLSRGAQVSATIEGGSTPLHSAAFEGHADVVEALLRHDADVNARRDGDSTPLHLAAYDGKADVVERLAAAGADLAAKDAWGHTALHGAEYAGYTDVADLLRQHGATE